MDADPSRWQLEVSLSSDRAWKRGGTADRQGLTNAQLLALMQSIHAELKGADGSPRMVRELRARGFPANKTQVERLRREHGIRGRHKRRHKATTDAKHGLPVAENLLTRLDPERPESGLDRRHHVPVDR